MFFKGITSVQKNVGGRSSEVQICDSFNFFIICTSSKLRAGIQWYPSLIYIELNEIDTLALSINP